MTDKAFNDYLVRRMAAYIARWPVAERSAAAAAAAPADGGSLTPTPPRMAAAATGGALTGRSSSRPLTTKRHLRQAKPPAEPGRNELTTRM